MSALAGTLIVETAERPAGEYAAKLLADLGAEVIKVERPGGAPTRTMGPFKAGESALFAYLNANKKSVMLDLEDAEDRAALDQLLARANALIDDHDEGWGAGARFWPRSMAVRTRTSSTAPITPFGQGAPAEWQIARSLNVINAGGWAYHTPTEADPERPPLKGAGRFLADYESGIDAALCVAASLYRQPAGAKCGPVHRHRRSRGSAQPHRLRAWPDARRRSRTQHLAPRLRHGRPGDLVRLPRGPGVPVHDHHGALGEPVQADGRSRLGEGLPRRLARIPLHAATG